MKVTFRVTQEDIDLGVSGNTCWCMFANSLWEAGMHRPWVTTERIGWTDASGTRWHLTDPYIPAALKEAIEQYDADPSQVKPFSVELDLNRAVEPYRNAPSPGTRPMGRTPVEARTRNLEYTSVQDRVLGKTPRRARSRPRAR